MATAKRSVNHAAAGGHIMVRMPRRNPAHADVFVSCSGDCSVKVWDARQPGPTLSIAAHRYEARPPAHQVSKILCLGALN